ncbi:MAG: glycosyltransferase [Methanobacteriota archaeon]|nr:MAG: glycosyltransferase [Euryarchaeota archaeon]
MSGSIIEDIKGPYRHFDKIVAKFISKNKFNIIIGYENTTFYSFRHAKRDGVITILDLAHIHQAESTKISKEWKLLEGLTTREIKFMNLLKSRALKYTDYCFTLSTWARDSMIKQGFPRENLFIYNLGLNLKLFKQKKYYAVNGPLRLLFVGTITRKKGLDILFEAVGTVNKNAIELTLVGPMGDGRFLLDKFKGQFRYVTFVHHEELVKYYQQADLFIFPSYLDSWAQTVLEAMACGTPVIVSENTGSQEAVKEGAGFVIPPGDVGALAKNKMVLNSSERN